MQKFACIRSPGIFMQIVGIFVRVKIVEKKSKKGLIFSLGCGRINNVPLRASAFSSVGRAVDS